jgi:hypothetical protein
MVSMRVGSVQKRSTSPVRVTQRDYRLGAGCQERTYTSVPNALHALEDVHRKRNVRARAFPREPRAAPSMNRMTNELDGAVIVDFPLRGERWVAENTPGDRIPSHGTDMLGQRFAYDLLKGR